MKILLAEDDVRLGQLILHKLTKENHSVDWVKNGSEALDYLQVGQAYDVAILDWMIPQKSGVDVCRQLRKAGNKLPIIMLTARDAIDDRVQGLDAGADDYLVKPFEFVELLARIRAVTRRGQLLQEENILRVKDLMLNTKTYELIRGQAERIELTKKELQLLELFMRNKGQVIPRSVIFDRIWGYDVDVNDNMLDALVKLLRKKIDHTGKETYIQTVRGVGYRIEES